MIRNAGLLLLLVGVSASVSAQDWTRFRGPNGTGFAKDVRHPVEWSETKNISWKIPVPGVAWSQPVISGKRVYLTTAVAKDQPRPLTGETGTGFSVFSSDGISRLLDNGGTPPESEYEWKLLCLNLNDGDTIWEKTVYKSPPPIAIHRSNSYASETPVIENNRIYVYVAMVGIYCFDMDGSLVWKRKIKQRRMQYGWGTGSSLLVHKKRVYLQCDNEDDSFLLACDAATGADIWHVDREEASNWSTPWIWKHKQREELVTVGGNKVRSYDPLTGSELWSVSAHGRSTISAVGDEKRVFVGSVTRTTGTRADLMAIAAGASGDVTDDATGRFRLWSAKQSSPEVASPLFVNDRLFAVHQFGGLLSCLDADTGERIYRKRLSGASGFTASPWAMGDLIFCLDENGRAFAMNVDGEVVATNKLDGMFWASPAIANGRLLLRSVDHLYCIARVD